MKKYHLTLTQDELIILSDFLYRFTQRTDIEFKDQAEQRVLWIIESQLEKLQENIFSAQYEKDLHAAYERIRDKTQ